MSPRAALDAARAVFEPSLGGSPSDATATPVWRETPDAHARPRARAMAMWHAAERVLQSVLGRPELTGQALVSEARHQQFLTLGDGHALVALQGWVDRVQEAADTDLDAPPNDSERSVAREAWMALEHAVDRPMAPPPAAAAARSSRTPPARRSSRRAGTRRLRGVARGDRAPTARAPTAPSRHARNRSSRSRRRAGRRTGRRARRPRRRWRRVAAHDATAG
ncbi:MAG: hypothetical protein ABMA00_11930, partial [Gemmatimonas sp.]